MTLIKCSECGKEISDKAVSCPNCGCPVNLMNTNTQNTVVQEIKENDIKDEVINNSEIVQIDDDGTNKDTLENKTNEKFVGSYERNNILNQAAIEAGELIRKNNDPDIVARKLMDKHLELNYDEAFRIAKNAQTTNKVSIVLAIIVIIGVIFALLYSCTDLGSSGDSSNYAAQAQKEVRNILSSGIIYGYTSYVVGEVYHVSCTDKEQDNNGRHYIACTVEYYPKRNNGLVALDSRKIEVVYGIGMKIKGEIDINYKYMSVFADDFKKENCWNQDKSKGLSCNK